VGASIASHSRKCYGCGVDHACGLHMQVEAGPDLTLTSVFHVSDQHQGAPGSAHGGVLTAAMEEALGALNWLFATPAVTARLETDFLRPVPVGTELHIDARITGVDGRKVYCAAHARAGVEGPIVARASALFIQVKRGHFREHGRPQDVAEAVARGEDSESAELNP
jgi:acyl-coenzyme A thioesterase PaaI-like protein